MNLMLYEVIGTLCSFELSYFGGQNITNRIPNFSGQGGFINSGLTKGLSHTKRGLLSH